MLSDMVRSCSLQGGGSAKAVVVVALSCNYCGGILSANGAMAEKIEWQQYQDTGSCEWTYVIYKAEPVDTNRVIYFFHGAGGGVFTWLKAYKKFRDEWGGNGLAHPVVVAVSFGPKWIFVPNDDLGEKGILEKFWQEIVPHIESQLSGQVVHRYAIGQSMGGYNALQLALDQPQFFEKMVLTSPAIFNLSLYAGDNEVYAYAKRTGTCSYLQRLKFFLFGRDVQSLAINKILESRRGFIPDHQAWEKSSVFRNARNKVGPNFPSLFVTCGDKDEFGLHEGAKILVDIVNENGGAAEFHLLDGKHMVRDDRSAVFFLDDRKL